MTRVFDALQGVNRLGFDTSPIIYFIEEHPDYDSLVSEVFQTIADGTIEGITSAITITEVLVHPFRNDDQHLQQKYRDILLRSRDFRCISITPVIAEHAAHLRAQYGIRTPDAIQIATAIHTECEAILTNDLKLKRVTELKVLTLNDLALST